MYFQPQLVSRISEPSTVWISHLGILAPTRSNVYRGQLMFWKKIAPNKRPQLRFVRVFLLRILMTIYTPRAPMTSIFEGEALKTRPFPSKTRVSSRYTYIDWWLMACWNLDTWSKGQQIFQFGSSPCPGIQDCFSPMKMPKKTPRFSDFGFVWWISRGGPVLGVESFLKPGAPQIYMATGGCGKSAEEIFFITL